MTQALPVGQSLADTHPHAWPMHCAPLALPAQLAHVPPPPPHAAALEPPTHAPLVAALQQPPLHGWDESHGVPHLLARQALPAGQSAALTQPQAVPLTHTWPVIAVEQSVHVAAVAQALLVLPVTHEPPPQQPPLHSCVDEQAITQRA